MSGGHFQYDQYKFGYIADEIERIVLNNERTDLDAWQCQIGRHYSSEVIRRFQEAIHAIRQAQIMVHRIDWLLSGDDGPDSFILRWDDELQKRMEA